MDNPDKKIKLVFCANDQKETEHAVTIDGNGEWIFTCNDCGRFIKFPESYDAPLVREGLKIHAESNIGQRSQASLDKKIDDLLAEL